MIDLEAPLTNATTPIQPMRKWRCSKGHEWQAEAEIVGIRFNPCPAIGLNKIYKFCWICFVEILKVHTGIVEEVP